MNQTSDPTDRAAQVHNRFSSHRENSKQVIVTAPTPVQPSKPVTPPTPVKPPEPVATKRKQIPLMKMDTAMQIHDRVQSRRYGSYRSIIKVSTVFAGMVFLAYFGQYLLIVPLAALLGYFWSDYDTDHDKYQSWSNRVAVIPDMSIYDDGPMPRVPIQKVRELLAVPKLPTILD